MTIGISNYGISLPSKRIKIQDICIGRNQNPNQANRLGIIEKTVPAKEQDMISLAITSSLDAITDKQKIEAIFVGSETHAYAVKPSSSLIAGMLGLTNPNLYAADLEFACKGGTAALQVTYAYLKAGLINTGLAVGSDTGHGRPGDALEFSAAAGAASFELSSDPSQQLTTITETISVATDTADFWRNEQSKYPSHAGRFSAHSYNTHVAKAINLILEKTQTTIQDYDHVILHCPNLKLPSRLAKKLGITLEQLTHSMVASHIGNTYAANSLLTLANVLDNAKPGQKILLCSYGSGAGCDAFTLETTDKIGSQKSNFKQVLENKTYIDYTTYLQLQ